MDDDPTLDVTRFAGQPAKTAPVNALRRRMTGRPEPKQLPPRNALRDRC